MAKPARRGLGRGLNSLMPEAGDTGVIPRTTNRERVTYTEEEIGATTDQSANQNTLQQFQQTIPQTVQQNVSRETIRESLPNTNIPAREIEPEPLSETAIAEQAIVTERPANTTSNITQETPVSPEHTEDDWQTRDSSVSRLNTSRIQVSEKEEPKEGDISKILRSGIAEIPIDLIEPNPDQPRTSFKQEELDELARSIKRDGLLQPILIRSIDNGKFQIIAGERRWQASKLAGLEKIPVRAKDVDDDKALELALIENVQRSDLNPIEEAYGYRRLMDRRKMTQADVAQAMSKGRSTVANALRLLDLPEDAQQLLFEDKITAGHARAILSIPNKEGREALTNKLKENNLTVRETESIARLLSNKPERSSSRSTTPESFKRVAKVLREILKTNVKVKSVRGKNRIEIDFENEEQLGRIFEELLASVS